MLKFRVFSKKDKRAIARNRCWQLPFIFYAPIFGFHSTFHFLLSAYFTRAEGLFILADACFTLADVLFISAGVLFTLAEGLFILADAYFTLADVFFILAEGLCSCA